MREKKLMYVVIVMILGLLSRKFEAHFPFWVGAYAGDVLWALMIFFVVQFLFPKFRLLYVTIFTLLFCYLDELTQLYHAQWIAALRASTIGGLILGFQFSWSDIFCYTVGVGIGVALQLIGRHKSNLFNI